MKYKKIIVKGLVQGVGFRFYCAKKAQELSIKGFARNMEDGSVLIEAEGDDSLIEEFVACIQIGPPMSRVNSIKVEDLEYKGKFTSFRIY